jgi:hypothetical protein
MASRVILSREQRRIAEQELAQEKDLRCPTCDSGVLEADREGRWRFGVPGEDFEIIMWCADPTHGRYVPLIISKEEVLERLGLSPQTD